MGQRQIVRDLDIIDTNRRPVQRTGQNAQPVRRTAQGGQPVRRTAQSGQPVRRTAQDGQPVRRTAQGGQPVRRTAQGGQPPMRTPRVLTEEEKRARARARHEAMIRQQKAKARRAQIVLVSLLLILGVLVIVLFKVLKDEKGNEPVEANNQPQGTPVSADTEPPVVSSKDIEIEVGETISYRNAITYSDNVDTQEDLTLSVDNRQVNTGKAGVYTATYTVTDKAGNVASGSLTVTVKEPVTPEEQEVYDMADAVLAEILTDDMDMKQQARVIYNWIRSNVHYVDHSEKDSWVQGAHDGLSNRKGDCFVFASTAKVLLTRAGIPNLDIVKATTNPSHYWNLIDVGDGWYHYDTTPRKDGSEFFMWTDEQIEAYSKEHNNCHNFDRSLYPTIN